MIRRPLLIVAVLVLVAGTAVNAGWYYARFIAGRAVDDWAEAQRGDGIDVTWAERTITGWPLRLDGLFRAPRATMAAPNRQIAWRGPNAAVRFYLLAPDTIDFGAPGQHLFTVTEDGTTANFTLDAGSLVARTEKGLGGTFHTLSAGGTALRLTGPEDAPLASAKAVQMVWDQPVGNAAEQTAGTPPISLTMLLRADSLKFAPGVLPPTPAPVLGNEISVIRADAALNGVIDPHQPVPQALAGWRDAGGIIDVNRLEIVWGPLHMAGDGTLALDAALQPEGAFSVRVSGLTDVLTAMENASMIDARTAAIARITLAVLARPPENGGPPEARVPLTIQNGRVSVGPVALLKLPTIVWR